MQAETCPCAIQQTIHFPEKAHLREEESGYLFPIHPYQKIGKDRDAKPGFSRFYESRGIDAYPQRVYGMAQEQERAVQHITDGTSLFPQKQIF